MTPSDRIRVYPGPPLRRLLDERGGEEQILHVLGGAGVSGVVNMVADRYQEIVRRSMPELTEKEWFACADALNGVWLSDAAGMYLGEIWIEIADSDRLNGLGEKWGIDAQDLARRLRGMPFAAVLAVVDVVERLWAQPQSNWSDRLRLLGALSEDTVPRTGESTAPFTDDQVSTLVELIRAGREADYWALCAAMGVINGPRLWDGTRRRLGLPVAGKEAAE